MKKLLWIGDAGCPSGFALATHKILETLDYRTGGEYDVTVLGLNYRGDPHQYAYPIYAAAAGGDLFGILRLIWICDRVEPDLIVLQNDPWNIPFYVQMLRRRGPDNKPMYPEYANIPIVGLIAVDGKNCRGDKLNGLSVAVFWTDFALEQAGLGGFTKPGKVIPLGVDLSLYKPMSKSEARAHRFPTEAMGKFVVGSVGRNQTRKRLDLTIRYFANWVKEYDNKDAWLYLHVAPTGEVGYDLHDLVRYYGVAHRTIIYQPEVFYGITELEMMGLYNCFDVYVSTAQGEGFGLTALEAMACAVPPILPDNSAYGEWAKGAAWLVRCTGTAATVGITTPSGVIGAVPDEAPFIQALQRLYCDEAARKQNAQAALERAQEPQFRWKHIGERVAEVLDDVLNPKPGKKTYEMFVPKEGVAV